MQVASKSFDLEANLALLRLYQFQPHLAKPAVLAKVLVKALMQLPSPDYKLCIHLVPERSQAEEPVASVVALADSLENTKLSDFWAACSGSLKGLLDAGTAAATAAPPPAAPCCWPALLPIRAGVCDCTAPGNATFPLPTELCTKPWAGDADLIPPVPCSAGLL